jgi:hypothetical protein
VGESVQKSQSNNRKRINPKFWLMGVSALLAMKTANAQENTLKNDSLPAQKVTTPVDSIHLKQDSLTTKFPVDFLDMNTLLLLPVDHFLDAIGAINELTDIDSIMQLPRSEIDKEIQKAGQRPTRIEIETLHITKLDSIDWDDTDYTSTLKNAFYVEAFNLIRLRRFVPDTTQCKNPDPYYLELIEAVNEETKFAFVHELTHRRESDFNLAGLNFEQLFQNSIYYEHIPRVLEKLYRRRVYLATGDIKRAFPRACFFARHDPSNKTESYEYIEWLTRQKDLSPDSLSVPEADVIFKSTLRDANREFVFYQQEGQFAQQTLANMYKALRQQRSYIRQPNTESICSFDELTRRRYSTEYGNLLDLISTEMLQAFLDIMHGFAYNLKIQKQLIPLREKYNHQFRPVANIVRTQSGVDSQQKYDVYHLEKISLISQKEK